MRFAPWYIIQSASALLWTTLTGSFTFSSDGLTADSSSFSTAHTNDTYSTDGIDCDFTIERPVGTSSGYYFAWSTVNTSVLSGDIEYGGFMDNTNRFRIHENGSWVGNILAMEGDKITIVWNGAAMEYYQNDVLKYTGSYTTVTNSHIVIRTNTDSSTITITRNEQV